MTITTGATVTLSGDGVYIFRPAGALDPAANSSVITAEGACTDNVFWTPDGGTTIGANATFVGTVFRGTAAGLSITLGDSASLEGRALAFGSTVTTANNAITVPDACPGTIVVEKQTNPEGSLQSFSFTGDAAGDLTDNGQIVVDNLVPGNYSSTETLPAGWELTDIVCNDTDSSGDLTTATANFVVGADETVTCVFINTELPPEQGTITILKQATPSDTGQSFDFSGDLGNFSLMDGEFLVETRSPGVYAVSETVPADWQLDSATCSDGSPVSAIDLQNGENVTCTFTNSQLPGTIIVEKQTNPVGSLQSFSFSGDATGELMDNEQIVVGNLAPDTYSVTESVPVGWELTDIVCNDTDSSGHLATSTANFVVGAGETVTCVFINTELPPEQGTITILKQATPSDTGQSFDFSGDLGNFSLMDGEFIVETRSPGVYAVSETVPAGWRLDSATCSDGSPVSAIGLQNGENVTCTFTNSQLPGTIIVEKQTNPEDSLQSFSFTGDAAGDLTDNGQIVVDNLAPGNYSSTETLPAGWELTDIVCNVADSSGDLTTATANFVVDADETVTCVFINTELPPEQGTITILKQASPPDTGQSFEFSGDLGSFSLMDGEFIVETLAPGTYAVDETVPVGWQLDSALCDDGMPVDAIDLEAGENVSCTFTNSQLPGTIIVEKQTNPVGSLQSFDFSGDAAGELSDNEQIVVGNLSPGNYSSTEILSDGWELTDIFCNDADSTADIEMATANFELDAGETVTCVFINTEATATEGTITILKQASPSDTGQSFSFSGDLGTFNLRHAEFIVETRPPGVYTVSETVPAGWQLDSATCDDGSQPDAIDLESGESVTCTFSNSMLAPLGVPVLSQGGIVLIVFMMMVIAAVFMRYSRLI